ncbi:hypothetical protein QDX23_03490 [Auritidibacter ignavus]|uniref:phage minor capsid protein n=1 Tax=Auritidibacter ignavus TaxID=678932 RepID=UPI00244B86B6|nr:phage minor capsid protein [Auritidibacter ignavus]WGH91443.1 hypothetical protein QDX23_03490 [Auritidibacter ignavus]
MVIKWTPPAATPLNELVEDIAHRVASAYAQAEHQLIVELANKPPETLGWDAQNWRTLQKGRVTADTLVKHLENITGDEIRLLIERAQQEGLASALAQLRSLPLGDLMTGSMAPAAYSIASDLHSALTDVRARILRAPDDIYRSIIGDSVLHAVVAGGNRERDQARPWRELINRGITGFTGRAGRRWNLASYVEMASRTATARAYRAQHEHTMKNNGVRFCKIVGGNDMCEQCGPWANRVLAMDGTPAGTYHLDSMVDDSVVTINVDATIEDARTNGLFHPNCRCIQVAYLPGVEPVIQAPTYDAGLEKERDRLRHLERETRRAKREMLITPSPETATRIQQLDNMIQDHVEKTGLNRKRYRENLNLGHKPARRKRPPQPNRLPRR